MAYTSQSNIEAFLGRSLTTSESNILTQTFATVDAFINNELDYMGAEPVGFGDVSETTRYYDGGTKIIDIHPCDTVTAVKRVYDDETESHTYTLNEDFELRPRNGTTKKYIHSRIGAFTKGVANIAVTAMFRWGSSVPSDIEWLATYLSSHLFSDSFKTGVKTESIEGYSRAFLGVLQNYTMNDQVVRDILARYNKDDFVI